MQVSKEKLKDYGEKLMFRLEEEQYETLETEFDVILEQMKLIEQLDGIEQVEPMTFPFECKDATFREDVVGDTITPTVALANAKDTKGNEIRVPKVVE